MRSHRNLRYYLLKALTKNGVEPSAEQVEELLRHAGQVVAQKPNLPFTSPLMLATEAALASRRRGSVLDLADAERLRQALRNALARFHLLGCLATHEKLTANAVEADAHAFRRLHKLAKKFEAASAPPCLDVLERYADFEDRVGMFWHRIHEWATSDLKQHAEGIFFEVLGEKFPNGHKKLIKLITPLRIAASTDADLRRIAEEFNWQALVGYLAQRRSDGPRDPDIEFALADLVKRLSQDVAKKLGASVAEDAAHDAIVSALEAVTESSASREMNEDFWNWMRKRTMSNIRRYLRTHKPPPAKLPPPPEESLPSARGERREFLAQQICQFLFVRLYFHEHERRLLHAWVMRAMFDDAVTDEMLSVLLKLSGEITNANALGIMRHRVRRRLRAVEYAFDARNQTLPNFGDLAQAVSYAAGGKTVSDDERVALETAAAYGLAARAVNDPLMLAAGMVYIVINADGGTLKQAEQYAGEISELWLAAGGPPPALPSQQQLDAFMVRLQSLLRDVASPLKGYNP